MLAFFTLRSRNEYCKVSYFVCSCVISNYLLTFNHLVLSLQQLSQVKVVPPTRILTPSHELLIPLLVRSTLMSALTRRLRRRRQLNRRRLVPHIRYSIIYTCTTCTTRIRHIIMIMHSISGPQYHRTSGSSQRSALCHATAGEEGKEREEGEERGRGVDRGAESCSLLCS